MKQCGVYSITNLVNGKRYIGRSIDIQARWALHIWKLKKGIHNNMHLQNAWDKYGPDSFRFEIVELCTPDVINDREIYYIALYNTTDSAKGYNWTCGGDGALVCNEEYSKMKSESLKKHYRENPEKAKIRFEHVKEALQKEESRKARREQTLKQFQDPVFYAEYRRLRSSKEYREKKSANHIWAIQYLKNI